MLWSVGRSSGLEAGLDAARKEIDELEGELQANAVKEQQLNRQLEQSEQHRMRQLAAIARGFILSVYFRTESVILEPRY
ncbi:hypothetical protein [Solemya velesiana gill symbiont]|uniref:Uncharacterized protein n=1 Tax=Solemya velesiana gill symbiont TaxID=1918948 RepID=A0A1T2KVR1_9GAMM|nr:hypothetical protein [Solemya velesiana gill symbiont]OOZ36891.1 hypothetical protein BOW51_04985 [Solemya velesiana gill symbiont]